MIILIFQPDSSISLVFSKGLLWFQETFGNIQDIFYCPEGGRCHCYWGIEGRGAAKYMSTRHITSLGHKELCSPKSISVKADKHWVFARQYGFQATGFFFYRISKWKDLQESLQINSFYHSISTVKLNAKLSTGIYPKL